MRWREIATALALDAFLLFLAWAGFHAPAVFKVFSLTVIIALIPVPLYLVLARPWEEEN